MTTSHALEDKYNAEDDAKKFKNTKKKKKILKQIWKNCQTQQVGVYLSCLLELRKKQKVE